MNEWGSRTAVSIGAMSLALCGSWWKCSDGWITDEDAALSLTVTEHLHTHLRKD